jgi:hypothetical protein
VVQLHPILRSKLNHNSLLAQFFAEFQEKEAFNEGFTDSIENTINYVKYTNADRIELADAYVQGIEMGKIHKDNSIKSLMKTNIFSNFFYKIALKFTSK